MTDKLDVTQNWWDGKGIPLCRDCKRPLSEHWDFPDICAKFEASYQLPAHQPAAAQESVEVVDNILRIAGQLRRSEIAYDNARAKILAAITEWKALGDD